MKRSEEWELFAKEIDKKARFARQSGYDAVAVALMGVAASAILLRLKLMVQEGKDS